jgi:hypothetical protein
MGFSSFPPRLRIASILATIDAFAPHSDAVLIVTEPIDSLIRNNQLGLANYFRSRG